MLYFDTTITAYLSHKTSKSHHMYFQRPEREKYECQAIHGTKLALEGNEFPNQNGAKGFLKEGRGVMTSYKLFPCFS